MKFTRFLSVFLSLFFILIGMEKAFGMEEASWGPRIYRCNFCQREREFYFCKVKKPTNEICKFCDKESKIRIIALNKNGKFAGCKEVCGFDCATKYKNECTRHWMHSIK